MEKKKKLRAFLIPSYIPNLSQFTASANYATSKQSSRVQKPDTLHSNRSQPLLSCQHLHNLPRPRDTKLDRAHGVQAHTELQQGVNKGSNNEQKKCCPQEMDRWAAWSNMCSPLWAGWADTPLFRQELIPSHAQGLHIRPNIILTANKSSAADAVTPFDNTNTHLQHLLAFKQLKSFF